MQNSPSALNTFANQYRKFMENQKRRGEVSPVTDPNNISESNRWNNETTEEPTMVPSTPPPKRALPPASQRKGATSPRFASLTFLQNNLETKNPPQLFIDLANLYEIQMESQGKFKNFTRNNMKKISERIDQLLQTIASRMLDAKNVGKLNDVETFITNISQKIERMNEGTTKESYRKAHNSFQELIEEARVFTNRWGGGKRTRKGRKGSKTMRKRRMTRRR